MDRHELQSRTSPGDCFDRPDHEHRLRPCEVVHQTPPPFFRVRNRSVVVVVAPTPLRLKPSSELRHVGARTPCPLLPNLAWPVVKLSEVSPPRPGEGGASDTARSGVHKACTNPKLRTCKGKGTPRFEQHCLPCDFICERKSNSYST